MSSYSYKLIPAAKRDLDSLDGSQKKAVLKALDKLVLNPKSIFDGGYGQPLGNKGSTKLSGLLKIKLRGAGIRIVYDLVEKDGVVCVIVIGLRKDEEVYKEAAKRLRAYMEFRAGLN